MQRSQSDEASSPAPCFSDEMLRRRLADELGEAASMTVDRHIDVCTTCMERLAQLADDEDGLPEGWREVFTAEADSTDSQVLDEDFAGTRFRILGLHGSGGLGEVFRAFDEELHREVALKRIKPQHADDAQRRARFLVEAEIAGNLEHPGIVPVYGRGRDAGGRPFYAMRFVRGQTLKTAIEEFHAADVSNQDPGERAITFRQLLSRYVLVCEAIHYAHRRGVIHRDLKPANIMLGPDGETIVVDWGLAKSVGRPESAKTDIEQTFTPPSGDAVQATADGSHLGTPAFMSPEQALGRPDAVGIASDIYSLGATLYCLLTGQAPFADTGLPELQLRVIRGDFPVPRSVNSAISPALNAVCLKAMAHRPEDRYVSASALAEDIERWLADEPVTVHRDALAVRFTRWARRNQAIASIAAAACILALIGAAYLTYNRQKRLVTARNLADALSTADTRAIENLIARLEPDRHLVRDRLYRLAKTHAGKREGVAAALALLPEDPAQTDVLTNWILDPSATPEEIVLIREALKEHGSVERIEQWSRRAILPRLIEMDEEQLQAAAALVWLKPEDSRWESLAGPIAKKLVQEHPLYVVTWSKIFQPIAGTLKRPLLDEYAKLGATESRALAFELLFAFALQDKNPRSTTDLIALLGDSDPAQFKRLVRKLRDDAHKATTVKALTTLVSEPAQFDPELARRQGRFALALVHLEQSEPVCRLFQHSADPSVRTELIHNLREFGVKADWVIQRLQKESDQSARRGMILCLGEFDKEEIPKREALTAELLKWYRSDPDAGMHSAIGWLLRKWQEQKKELDDIDEQLKSKEIPEGRNWHVNTQKQTFALVPGPITFTMGSPQVEPLWAPELRVHKVRIDRSFAIATHEVTVRQYEKFLKDNPALAKARERNFEYSKKFTLSDDHPRTSMSWYDAAAYCNWLSKQEGIPEKEWCYPTNIPVTISPGYVLEMPQEFWKKKGYRLPTEAEWEYACRASARTSRPYGASVGWLPKYGWALPHSDNVAHAVGELRPNDLGLFDVLGNAWEWLQDSDYDDIQGGTNGTPIQDDVFETKIFPEVDRRMRGGCFFSADTYVRVACVQAVGPEYRFYSMYGLRLARTYR